VLFRSGALYYLQKELAGLDQIIRWEGLVFIYALVLAVGILLSVVAACLAVNRYLKMKRGKMYYI
jgi:cell division transport system permease protein